MLSKEKKAIEMIKNTYCRIMPSKIHGVGIVAIRNIPKGTNIFYGVYRHQGIRIKMSELKDLNKEIKKMLNDFLVITADKRVILPDFGLNGMDISFFLNESDDPNVITTDGGENFITRRDVKKGEELTVNYGTYDFD